LDSGVLNKPSEEAQKVLQSPHLLNSSALAPFSAVISSASDGIDCFRAKDWHWDQERDWMQDDCHCCHWDDDQDDQDNLPGRNFREDEREHCKVLYTDTDHLMG